MATNGLGLQDIGSEIALNMCMLPRITITLIIAISTLLAIGSTPIEFLNTIVLTMFAQVVHMSIGVPEGELLIIDVQG